MHMNICRALLELLNANGFRLSCRMVILHLMSSCHITSQQQTMHIVLLIMSRRGLLFVVLYRSTSKMAARLSLL